MATPIKWGGSDPFTHMLITGATRSGKTATILKPMIEQILLAKKRGVEVGLSVVEPKGDVALMVAEMSEAMGLDYVHIDPTRDDSANFNPMEGEANDVAEATVVVLKGLFGKQDAFFATVQELSARNVVKLLKELQGDNLDIVDVMNTLRDPLVLKQKVEELKRLKGQTDLVHFFENELLGSMAEKYRQFVIGLRAQLENIVSNDALRKIMTNRSDINIDEHFEKGGILAVNTALGMLRTSGDAFGQFIIMHLQNGTFRRPGTEDTRVPHFLIVDEYSRYINPDVEIFLSLAAEYRVAGIFAIQSLGQLEIEAGKIGAKAMKRSILTNCRNKIVFGGVGMEDAREFAEMFGKDKIIMRQSTYKNRILLPVLFPEHYRDTETEEYRFDATDILDGLPRFTYIHQLVQNGVLQEPGIGLGTFVPRNWRELKKWETPTEKAKTFSSMIKDFLSFDRRSKKDVAEPRTFLDLSEDELKEVEAEAEEEEKSLLSQEREADRDALEKRAYVEGQTSAKVNEKESELKQVENTKLQNNQEGGEEETENNNKEDNSIEMNHEKSVSEGGVKSKKNEVRDKKSASEVEQKVNISNYSNEDGFF